VERILRLSDLVTNTLARLRMLLDWKDLWQDLC